MGRTKRTVEFSKFGLSQEELAGKVVCNDTGFDAQVYETRNTAPNGETIWRCDYQHECAQDKFGLPIYEQIKEDEAMTTNELLTNLSMLMVFH
eukprot:5962240-Prymnesium_polylepis.1